MLLILKTPKKEIEKSWFLISKICEVKNMKRTRFEDLKKVGLIHGSAKYETYMIKTLKAENKKLKEEVKVLRAINSGE